MLGGREWRRVAATGALESAVVLLAFAWAIEARGMPAAGSFAFSTLVFSELLRSFAARSEGRLLWQVGALTNLRLLAVVAASVALQLALPHVPLTRDLLGIAALPLRDCALALAVALIPVSLLEGGKVLARLPPRPSAVGESGPGREG